ncbi:MAG: protein-disulfide reductase DsbD domain-containing protein, partial [Planctomycetota bacterium]
MRKKAVVILWLVLIFAAGGLAEAAGSVVRSDVVTISVEKQHEVVVPGGKSALAVHFEPKEDWHFYASAETAPGGMNLKLKPSADGGYMSFSEAIFPKPHLYFDKALGKKLEVFSEEFTVFLPFSVSQLAAGDSPIGVRIDIEGAVCSDVQCRMPDFGQLSANLKLGAMMSEAKFAVPEAVESGMAGGAVLLDERLSYPMWFALGLAFLAGLSLNIMPCVWPVLPLVVLRLVEQAKKGKGKTV